jgi:hypothetical protein
MNRLLLLLAGLALLAAAADAARVGVVVEFPEGGTFMKCVDAGDKADAYEILQESGAAVTWTKDAEYGHGICAILDVGCQDSGCVCRSRHWNFFVNRNGAWTMSPVGYDGGSGCQEHYCAREGDVLGFTFSSKGDPPGDASYRTVCPPQKKAEPDIIGRAIDFPQKNSGYIAAGILLLLLVGYFKHKPWEYI